MSDRFVVSGSRLPTLCMCALEKPPEAKGSSPRPTNAGGRMNENGRIRKAPRRLQVPQILLAFWFVKIWAIKNLDVG